MVVAGWYCGELVFRHGFGVLSLPQSEAARHQHQSEYSHSGVPMQNLYTLEKIEEIVSSIFTDNLHEKRQLSLSYTALED